MTTHTIERLMLEANGLRFHALAAGPQRGPLVLLLHGCWLHREEPAKVNEALRKFLREDVA